MLLDRIQKMLQACESESPLFPPTELYNETWLLRLVLDWFSEHRVQGYFLSIPDDGRWFSEAWLSSPFLRRPELKKDRLAESWTHADAVIGHFDVGAKGKADVSLTKDATHFLVLEAKMFSRLSSGVTNAPDYDQAARTVGCIAEVLCIAERSPSDLTCLGFYVLAPKSQIDRGVFKEQLRPDSIQRKVEDRVQAYEGARDQWFLECFQPTLQAISSKIAPIPWEELIAVIRKYDAGYADSIQDFYDKCKDFNR